MNLNRVKSYYKTMGKPTAIKDDFFNDFFNRVIYIKLSNEMVMKDNDYYRVNDKSDIFNEP